MLNITDMPGEVNFDNIVSPEQRNVVTLSTRVLPLEEPTMEDDDQVKALSPQARERYEKVLEGARTLGETRGRFWNMLATTINKTGYKPPQDSPTIILDLACGRCDEGVVLSAYFGGKNYGPSSENVKLVGVDIKQEDIDKAIKIYKRRVISEGESKYVLPPNYEFITADATRLDDYPEVPTKADVVVIRNKHIGTDKNIWTKIFQQGLNRVSPEGIMIVTSYSDKEHAKATEALQGLDCEIIVNERNPFAKPLINQEISADRNVAILKRKKPEANRT